MNKKGIVLAVVFAIVGIFSLVPKRADALSFDQSLLISDGNFVATSSMDTAAIQRFLVSKNSYLKDFSENGRSAAQIIFDAAHGRYEAAGSINGISIDESTGTVSPGVILVTLQKEQSLVSSTNPSQGALNAAMGYGCPDGGGCNPNYVGFTKQVENAAWQLRYNYERAQGRGFSDYQVGQSFNFDGDTGTFSNRATASLYRYTPHVYNGNYNFWNLFHNTYQFQVSEYSYQFVSQNAYPTLENGQSYNFQLTVQNTGSTTWQRGVVNLATNRPQDRISPFVREGDGPSGWLTGNRIAFQEASVAPGANATFSFWMKNGGLGAGVYREYFRLVADGIRWMDDIGIYWNVTVPSEADRYHYQFVSQNAYPTIDSGESYNFQLTVKNTGTTTWQRGTVNLATNRARDRISVFTREGSGPSGWLKDNRIVLQEATVAPGANGTFSFWMRNDGRSPGLYREYFTVVADGITWMEDYGVYWDVRVPAAQERYSYSFVSQNAYPTLARGQSYNFQIVIKNTGTVAWSKNQVNLGTSRPTDRFSSFTREGDGPSGWLTGNRIAFQEASVAPGANATFSFWMRNDGLSPGVYREYFQPVVDGVAWLNDLGIYWNVTAQ